MSAYATAEGYTQRRIKTKREFIPQLLCPTRTVEVKTDNDTFLAKEFVIVSVVCNDNQMQMTLHRPIGYNDLEADEWVLSLSESVSLLHARKDHPKAGLHAKERRKEILIAYLESDMSTKFDVDEDTLTLTYYGHGRNVLVKDARKASKAQWIADHPPTEADSKKGLASSEKESDANYIEFLKDPDVSVETLPGPSTGMTRVRENSALSDAGFLKYFPNAETATRTERKQKISEYNASITAQTAVRGNAYLKSCETSYLEFIKDKTQVKAAHDKVVESPYETKAGQPAQFSQVPFTPLKGMNKEQACDQLMQLIAGLAIKSS